jgi:hypothetical protein
MRRLSQPRDPQRGVSRLVLSTAEDFSPYEVKAALLQLVALARSSWHISVRDIVESGHLERVE